MSGSTLSQVTTPDGKKVWYACLAVEGQEYRRILGDCQDLTEEQARKACEKMKLAATPTVVIQDVTFAELAEDWIKNVLPLRSQSPRADWIASVLRRFVLPGWGARFARSILAPELYVFYKALETTSARCVASTCCQYMSQIFRYGMATSRADRDPASELRGYVPRPTATHWPTILNPEKIGTLMRHISQIPNTETRLRVKLQAYTFTRSGECRKAIWDEVDLSNGVWTIPAKRMKMRKDHSIPLSPQVQRLLEQLKRECGDSKWLFPAIMPDKDGPMCSTTPLNALRALGYDTKAEICLHGFRAMATSILNEVGHFPPDAIERQLAHAEHNKIRAAYNRAEFLDTRRDIMIWWANWLDSREREVHHDRSNHR